MTLENRETLYHHFPDDIEVHTEVLMNQYVAHPRHASPRNFRIRLSQISRKIPSRFPDDFQVADNRVLDHRVFHE